MLGLPWLKLDSPAEYPVTTSILTVNLCQITAHFPRPLWQPMNYNVMWHRTRYLINWRYAREKVTPTFIALWTYSNIAWRIG